MECSDWDGATDGATRARPTADGHNAVRVQHWLGHHAAAFMLATYLHLLDGDLPSGRYRAREISPALSAGGSR